MVGVKAYGNSGIKMEKKKKKLLLLMAKKMGRQKSGILMVKRKI